MTPHRPIKYGMMNIFRVPIRSNTSFGGLPTQFQPDTRSLQLIDIPIQIKPRAWRSLASCFAIRKEPGFCHGGSPAWSVFSLGVAI